MSELASESVSQRLDELPTERSERGGEAGASRLTGRFVPGHPASPLREGVR